MASFARFRPTRLRQGDLRATGCRLLYRTHRSRVACSTTGVPLSVSTATLGQPTALVPDAPRALLSVDRWPIAWCGDRPPEFASGSDPRFLRDLDFDEGLLRRSAEG